MNANSKVRSLNCPSGIKGVVEVFEDSEETVRYTFWGTSTFNKLTDEDKQYVTKLVQEIVGGR
jgi:hypothetical protein